MHSLMTPRLNKEYFFQFNTSERIEKLSDSESKLRQIECQEKIFEKNRMRDEKTWQRLTKVNRILYYSKKLASSAYTVIF
jgi:hypothetical protein